MAFIPFHNINTATDGTDIELVAAGDNASNIKSITLTNIDTTKLTASLYIYDSSSNTMYYLIYNVVLPIGATLLLDSDDMLSFNNQVGGFSLNLTMGSTSDLISVLIKR